MKLESVFSLLAQKMLFKHEMKLKKQVADKNHLDVANAILVEYSKFKEESSKLDLTKEMSEFTVLCNTYYHRLLELNTSQDGKEIYPSTSYVEPSFIEEITAYVVFEALARVIENIDKKNWETKLSLNGDNTLVNYTIMVPSLLDCTEKAKLNLETKNVDVAISYTLPISLDGTQYDVSYPLFCAEVKSYIDKTMYDTVKSTASAIKRTCPKCKYIAVTTGWSVDKTVNPVENTDVDEIFVISKQRKRVVRSNGKYEFDHLPLQKLSEYAFNELNDKQTAVDLLIERGYFK